MEGRKGMKCRKEILQSGKKREKGRVSEGKKGREVEETERHSNERKGGRQRRVSEGRKGN